MVVVVRANSRTRCGASTDGAGRRRSIRQQQPIPRHRRPHPASTRVRSAMPRRSCACPPPPIAPGRVARAQRRWTKVCRKAPSGGGRCRAPARPRSQQNHGSRAEDQAAPMMGAATSVIRAGGPVAARHRPHGRASGCASTRAAGTVHPAVLWPEFRCSCSPLFGHGQIAVARVGRNGASVHDAPADSRHAARHALRPWLRGRGGLFIVNECSPMASAARAMSHARSSACRPVRSRRLLIEAYVGCLGSHSRHSSVALRKIGIALRSCERRSCARCKHRLAPATVDRRWMSPRLTTPTRASKTVPKCSSPHGRSRPVQVLQRRASRAVVDLRRLRDRPRRRLRRDVMWSAVASLQDALRATVAERRPRVP